MTTETKHLDQIIRLGFQHVCHHSNLFLLVEVVKMVGSNLEHGASFWSGMSDLLSNNGNDLQMCRYTRSRARQKPIPLSWDMLGVPWYFRLRPNFSPIQVILDLATSCTWILALCIRDCPLSGPSSWCTLRRNRWCHTRT
jgi:hypothetical protein